MGSPIALARLHSDADLWALACDDFVVRVIDISDQARKVVRTFSSHRGRITDLDFSPDARWLLTASTDHSIRVWDVAAARCIDWLSFSRPVVSLSMSRAGEFLATAHMGQNGISLWSNTKLLSGSVFLDSEPKSPRVMDIPLADTMEDHGGENNNEDEDEIKLLNDNCRKEEDVSEPLAKGQGIVTLSNIPRSRWWPLAHLDYIRKRNKPLEAPKAPLAAPFFLSTKSGLGGPEFVTPQSGERDDKTTASRIIHSGEAIPRSTLSKLLKRVRKHATSSSSLDSAEQAVLTYLKGLAPSAIDVQIRGLTLGPG